MKKFISQNSNNKIRITNCLYFLIFAFTIFLFGMLLLNLHTSNNDSKNSVFALTSGDYTYVVDEQDNTKVKITAYTGTSATLVVPSTLEDKTVNEIGDEAFANNNSLVNITIPNSVTKIGSSIFAGCKNLESISMPFMGEHRYTTIQSDDDEGFQNWDNDWLSEAYERTVYYWFEHVNHCYDVDGGLSEKDDYDLCVNADMEISGYIPKNLTTIIITNDQVLNCYAFSYYSKTTSIIIQSSVTIIGDRAFSQCHRLISMTIPSSVTSMGIYVFGSCFALTTIRCLATVPPTLGYNAFGNSGLTTIKVYEDVVGAYQNSSWGEWNTTIVGIPREPTFPNTGVGVDIILPSAIILTLTISIVFVAVSNRKRKVIIK